MSFAKIDIGVRLAALPYALKALQIVSLGGASVLLWNCVGSLASGFTEVVVPPLESAAGPAASRAEFAPYQRIGERNVFHAAPEAPKGVVEAPVAVSRLEVQLLGTVVAEPVARSVGVLRDPSTNTIVQVGVGDALAAGQAKVVRIEHRRIILEHAGRLEAVEFPEGAAPARRLGVRGRAAPARLRGDVDRLRRRNAQRSTAAGRGPGRLAAGNMMVRAMAAAEAEAPSVDSGGGVQVPELSDGSRAAAAGIEEGDRIVAVNGVRVQGGSALPLLLQSLSDGQSKAIDVDREGTPTHLDLPGDAVADLVRELEAAAD